MVPEPIAVLLSPPAVVKKPHGGAVCPLAMVLSPNAALKTPLAVVFLLNATLSLPTLTSSQVVPVTLPARNAALRGCHIMRVPLPDAGMVPTLMVPPARKPPSVSRANVGGMVVPPPVVGTGRGLPPVLAPKTNVPLLPAPSVHGAPQLWSA